MKLDTRIYLTVELDSRITLSLSLSLSLSSALFWNITLGRKENQLNPHISEGEFD